MQRFEGKVAIVTGAASGLGRAVAQRLASELPDQFLNKEAMGDNDLQKKLEDVRKMMANGDIDRAKFQATYAQLVADVRAKRPNAHIFMAVPPMLTDQFPLDNARKDLIAILQAVASAGALHAELEVM